MRKPYRSPLFYVGDKYKLYPAISESFPADINKFIEPFAGGGSVFLNVKARRYLINDIDSNVINLHNFLQQSAADPAAFFKAVAEKIEHYGLSRSYAADIVPLALKKQYVKTYYAKFNKTGFNQLKADYNAAEEKDPLLLYLLLIFGFNRMLRFNANFKYNLPVGNVDFNKNVRKALEDYFRLTQEKQPEMHNEDFVAFLDKIDYAPGDFVYADPPYLLTFSEYNKLWNEEEEKRLLQKLDELAAQGVKFAVSNITHYKGKVNDLFLAWSTRYQCREIKSNYISYHDNSNKSFREVLVSS